MNSTMYRTMIEASDFYAAKGYSFIEDAPWLVKKDAYLATKPENAVDANPTENGEYPVASGEQSLLQYVMDNFCPPAYERVTPSMKAFCITPCFRKEETYYAHTRPQFMKLELMHMNSACGLEQLLDVVYHAREFFDARVDSVNLKQTGESCGFPTIDICAGRFEGGYELGSYGIREAVLNGVKLRWAYGTGVAEPRYTIARQTFRKI